MSGRAATLLTYLALEETPLHRSAAAQLLWPSAGIQALRNLRVELTALRRQGIELSPNRSPFLRLDSQTELDALAAAPSADACSTLAATLGRPLLDFNDLGNAVLATWARRQRQRLSKVAQVPATYRTAHCSGHPQSSGTEAAADADSANRRAPPDTPGAADRGLVEWLAAHVLPDIQAFVRTASAQPQLLLYVGRPGSGRRESLERLVPQLGLAKIEVTAGPSLDDLLTALEVNMVATLGEPASLPDLAGLSRVGRMIMKAGPLAIVLRDAERLGTDSVRLIDFLMGLSHPLLVIAMTTPAGQFHLEGLLGHHDQPGWFRVLHAPALTPESLNAAAQDGDSRFEAIRQTEGFLAAIRCQLPTSSSARGRLGQDLKRMLRAEAAVALGDGVEFMQILALLPGPFTEATAQGTLSPHGLESPRARRLLRRALQAGILERVDSVLAVQMPEMHLRLPDAAPLLWFCSELQRAALAGSLDADVRQNLKRRLCLLPLSAQPDGPEVTLTSAESVPQLSGPTSTRSLPGGYVLLARDDGWTVMRLGAANHAVPRLELNFTPAATARHWQLQLRVQRLEQRPEDSGVHLLKCDSAGHDRRTLDVRPWSPPLEQGQWLQARGEVSGRNLCVSVHASDVILHLGRPQFS